MKLAARKYMAMAAVAMLLAAGGAARAAEKETDHWLALAATVKVGMTRAEVEKILPEWKPPVSGKEESVGSNQDVSNTGDRYFSEKDVSRKLANGIDLRSYFVGINSRSPVRLLWEGLPFGSVNNPKGKSVHRTEVYWVAEAWAVMVCYDCTGDAWGDPKNKLWTEVIIKKLKKPVSLKPTP